VNNLVEADPPEDADTQILQVLEAEPCSSVRKMAEVLIIPALTVYLHLTASLIMKARPFNYPKDSWFDLLGWLGGNCHEMDSLANGMIEIRPISQNGNLPGMSRADPALLKEPMITEIL
jgi:hypothetical protein